VLDGLFVDLCAVDERRAGATLAEASAVALEVEDQFMSGPRAGLRASIPDVAHELPDGDDGRGDGHIEREQAKRLVQDGSPLRESNSSLAVSGCDPLRARRCRR
jgi:hypothetical protein